MTEILIQLGGHRRDSQVRGHAIIDAEDEPLIGVFRWRMQSDGYAVRHTRKNEDGQASVVFMHRQLFGLKSADRVVVDHINGNRHDNRRANLRLVTRAQNSQNMRAHRDAGSAFRGVFYIPSTGKWVARVSVHLGHFGSEVEAARAAASFRKEHLPYSTEARLAEVELASFIATREAVA